MGDALFRQIGRAVRVLRTLRGYSYAEFAEKAQLSATYLRQIERGERDLGLGTLESISEGLKCDMRLLIPGDGRSAVASIVADLFDQAPEAEQEAIVFLLTTLGASPKKQAMLALANEDAERSSPALPRSRARERAGGRSSVQSRIGRKR
jgi:transcriptional regulator with XRE-family HTH domain